MFLDVSDVFGCLLNNRSFHFYIYWRITAFLTNTHASHGIKFASYLIYVGAQMISYRSKQTKILTKHSPI